MFGRIRHILKPFIKKDTRKTFTSIYRNKAWKTGGSHSGPGSTLDSTSELRLLLPEMLKELGIHSLLDAPCGDYHWMKETSLGGIDYTGVDVVEEIIVNNRTENPGVKFIVADIIKDPLPVADAVLCRDCFIHLPNPLIKKTIRNFQQAGIRYLITNTYDVEKNSVIVTGDYRPVNMEIAPFYLSQPIQKINDHAEEGPKKWLGAWLLEDVRV